MMETNDQAPTPPPVPEIKSTEIDRKQLNVELQNRVDEYGNVVLLTQEERETIRKFLDYCL